MHNLTDVSINGLTLGDGQVLTYSGTDSKWENKDPNIALSGLTTDVTISSPSGGQILTYNGTSHIWNNMTPAPIISSAYCELVMGSGQINMVTVGDWYDIVTSTIVFNNNNSSFSSNVFTNPSNGLIEYDAIYKTMCIKYKCNT